MEDVWCPTMWVTDVHYTQLSVTSGSFMKDFNCIVNFVCQMRLLYREAWLRVFAKSQKKGMHCNLYVPAWLLQYI